jgi:hypothetical protein
LAEKGRIENYKKAAELSFSFRNLIDSYPCLYSPHTMSTSTNANTVSKVYTFAGNELNSAVKSVIWNILNEHPHKAYLNRTHEVAVVHRHLLQILAISAGIRQQAIALTNIATNTYVAAVSLNNPMKTFNVIAFDHVNELIKELSICYDPQPYARFASICQSIRVCVSSILVLFEPATFVYLFP